MGLSILRFAVARGKIVATTKSHKYYVFMAMYVFFSARRRVFIRNFPTKCGFASSSFGACDFGVYDAIAQPNDDGDTCAGKERF